MVLVRFEVFTHEEVPFLTKLFVFYLRRSGFGEVLNFSLINFESFEIRVCDCASTNIESCEV